ncbi:unnamed protein product [Brassicogethes aeneus]|uniref:Major facilitator superfamily (MFS) profile domain-containing protein n=1 Tax=Brassicogethes aeneus TaxID=1431903 RepID=A0A9P0B114_BRAAE|nr:unnamed protein product [Brassicogethes aeneus]
MTEVPKRKNVDYEEAIECTGFGKYNILLIIACGLSLLSSNIESYSIGYVLPSAECDLSLTTTTKGILTTATFVGILISSLFWGYLSDKKGRRTLICKTLFMTFLASALSSFMPSFWGFVVLRFITGICISGPSAIIFAYFSEFQNARTRSKCLAFISTFIAFALIYLPALAWLLLSIDINIDMGFVNFTSWRVFILINSAPAALGSLCIYFLPESPQYLYSQGKVDEALEVMKTMYVNNTNNSVNDFPIENIQESNSQEKPRRVKNVMVEIFKQVTLCFNPSVLKYTLTACLLQVGCFGLSSGLLLWYPDIINQLSKAGNASLTVCEALGFEHDTKDAEVLCNLELNDNIYVQNLFIGLAYLMGYTSWSFVVKAMGNRMVFMTFMSISSLGAILICFISHKILIDVLFVAVLMLPGICVAVVAAMTVDLMPPSIAGMAICLTMTAGRLGSILTSSLVGLMLEFNCSMTFWLYSAILLVCIGLAFIFPKKSCDNLH